jgi:hypothetical protein
VSKDRVNEKGESKPTELEIQSEIIQKALHSVFGKHSQLGIHANPIVFRKPYYALFHHRQRIRDLAEKKSNTAEQKRHLGWLTDWMLEHLPALQKVQERLVDKGLIDFKHLPIIFEAGSIIIGHITESEETFIKRDTEQRTQRPECFLFHEISNDIEDKKTGFRYMDIKAFRWAYHDATFGLKAETIRIKEFPEPRKITELDCFPLKYLEEAQRNELVPNLIARGIRWCAYVEPTTLNYKGRTRCTMFLNL